MSEIVAALLGALIAIPGTILVYRNGNKQIYAQTVSDKRMQWIDNFREEVSIIVGTLRFVSSGFNKDEVRESILAAEKARAKLLTRLNHDMSKEGNEFNPILTKLLSEIDFINPDKEVALKIQNITKHILEPEWKKVKKEAGGKK